MTRTHPWIALLAVGALAIAAALWWPVESDPSAIPGPTSRSQASSPPATANEAVEVEAHDDRSPVETNDSVTTASPPEPFAEARAATFKGRAVDAHGRPLAGVLARVHGWPANQTRMDAYRRDHGEVSWQPPDSETTGADGRFEITFEPPPPFQFTLDLQAPDRVAVGGRWSSIGPGTVKDFGDVPLAAGARVTGRLTDASGRVVTPATDRRMRLSIRRDRRDRPAGGGGEIIATTSAHADLAADGTFAFREPVAPGKWTVAIRGFLLEEPNQVVGVEIPTTAFDVVVIRPESLLRVEGIVVDEAGQPVPGARIRALDVPAASSWINSSGRDGRFEVVQRSDAVAAGGRFRLQVQREGYRRTTSDEIGWGDRDVRVVMTQARTLEVLVVRADDRTPVEEYGLRVMSGSGIRSSAEGQAIGGWSHPHGITRVTTLESGGAKRVCVEPRKGSDLAPTIRTVQIDFESPPRLTIELPAARSQVVRLVRTDGTPVEGSRVELIEPGEREIRAGSAVMRLGAGHWRSDESGLLVDDADTDADGRCRLVGPVDEHLTIRCHGEHPPLVVREVVLREGELVLEVAAGATLVVRVDPPEVLRSWIRGAGVPAPGEVDRRSFLPSISVRRQTPNGTASHPPRTLDRAPRFDDSGVAVLRGIPNGSWVLSCRWWERDATGSSSSRSIEHPHELALSAGERREVALDASEYRTGSVAGSLARAGEPVADTRVTLRRVLSRSSDAGEPRHEYFATRTDDTGAFRRQLPNGRYTAYANVRIPAAGPDLWATARAEPSFDVRPDREIRVNLAVAVARSRFRIVDPAGEPVAEIRVWAVDPDPMERPTISPADPAGVITVAGTPGTYALACRIRSLRSAEAYREFTRRVREKHGGDAVAAAQDLTQATVELPPVTIPLDQKLREPIEVRLPEAWNR